MLIAGRTEWTDEAFDALAAHPDPEIRADLAQSVGSTGRQRARLVDDPDPRVRTALAVGPEDRHEPMPDEAYRRLATDPERRVRRGIWTLACLPDEARAVLDTLEDPFAAKPGESGPPEPRRPEPRVLDRAEVERLVRSDRPEDRLRAVRDAPSPPALGADPDPEVRLWLSMRPDLTERERAAIDHHVGGDDRLPVLDWVRRAAPETLDRCVRSKHVGLRRSAVHNPGLTPEHVAILAGDPDFAVRLMLCERYDDVPPHLVVRTYLEAQGRVLTPHRLLRHPAFPRTDLVRYADSPRWEARALVVMDPTAPAELIDRLSRDDDAGVRARMADDGRLSTERALELLADPATAVWAAANPNLPRAVLEQILVAAMAEGSPRPVTSRS
ncbi:hypothetical protein [Actinoplanes regularis]|uniref:hypothetical protein n=1 Tax=Actinoplanes regularis TaxID=52697 RepID=UPI0024A454EB|nr:hypothetical protein [Actinoplanes regularis]GLW28425.1 hypothetical protein Areg01_13650 [Actinoplanes regularis]